MQYPGTVTIINYAARYARRLANKTFVNVIDPCSRISNHSDAIACISNYNGYFNNILKIEMIYMFVNLKRLHGKYYELITDITTPEQIKFAILIGDAYGTALTSTLNYITQNYELKTKYDRDVIVSIFIGYLEDSLFNAITSAFDVKELTYDQRSIVDISILPSTAYLTENSIDLSPINKTNPMMYSTDDLINNNMNNVKESKNPSLH